MGMPSQSPSKDPVRTHRFLTSGIDTLYLTQRTNPIGSALDFAELAYLKEKARSEPDCDFVPIQLGTEDLALRPYGRTPYAYVLGNEDIEIRLAERMQPNLSVRFSSKALWHQGIGTLLKRIREWRESVGLIDLAPSKVSRADIAFDYHLGRPGFEIGDFVSRSTKDSQWRDNRALQTLSFGTGAVVIRVYDKSAEIREASGKAWFHDIWGISDGVWRIEFQLRREALAEGGIDTPRDLFEGIAPVLDRLARRHTSLRRPTADKTRSRWPLHPLWEDLLFRITAFTGQTDLRMPDEGRLLELRRRQQARSLYGFLKGYGALCTLDGQRPYSLSETLKNLSEALQNFHSEGHWGAEIARRVDAYGLGKW